MKRMELIIILLVLPNLVWCFNLDPKTARVRTDISSRNKDNYFGYAVQFYNRSDSLRLIVGAPKTRSEYDAPHPSGAVHDCLVTGGYIDNCKTIKLYQKEESTLNTSKLSNNEYRKDAWIGGALSVNEKTGVMAVCGAQRENVTHLNGVCYILPDMHKWKNKDITETLFLLNKKEQMYNKTEDQGLQYIVTTPFYSLQEAGIFVRSFDDEIIIGTPGVFHLKGNDKDQIKDQFTNDAVPDSYFNNDTLFQSYFGYSVAGGKFFKNQTKSYIFGAPSVGNYTGNVFVFDIPKNWNGQKITPKLGWKGQQMGEYFGEAVCVADLNSDGYDDISVGAPRHSGNNDGKTRNNEGKVYVYLNTGEGNFREMDDLAGSKISGPKFGSAISFIGDLDHDGFPEIAVGAPHEQEDSFGINTGCIYIYKAGKNGVSTKHVQRIRSQDVSMHIHGFGISISNGFDVDDNKFIDIAVGAHKSSHVILIKSKPLVNVYHSVKISGSSRFEIQQDTTRFNLQICVKYEVPYARSPKNLDFIIGVTVEKNRAYFHSSGRINFTLSYNAALEIGNFSCTNKTVFLNTSYFENISTYYSSLVIGLNYSVAKDLSKELCLTCPVMNQSQSWFHAIKIPVEPKCDYGTCCRGWTISAELPKLKEPFIIGSQFSTPLTVEVVNNGVISTLRHIQIDLPNETSLLNIPHEFKCSPIQKNSWKCLNDLMFPTERKKILKFDLNIRISKIGSGFARFNFSLFCSNETKTYKLSLKLKDQTLKVSAEANPTQINSDIIEGNSFVTLTHDYRILNSGFNKSVHFKCGIPENVLWTNSTLPLLESHNLTVISKKDSSCNKRHGPPSVEKMNELQSPPTEDIFTYTYGYLYYDCSASVDAEGLVVQIKVQISVEALDLLLKNSTHFNYNTFITIFHESEGELKESVGTRFNTASRPWPFYILWTVLVILVVILLLGILHYRKHRLTTYDFRPSIWLRLDFL